ncbi:zinc finger C2HC domain-containing protein 1A-like [Antennarius striatus]|uniref:zinc finger C2HC domain-containing protein 1A-like n=1 Tax=Antennarius striatus TaxID=241820 RepID=UPI0035B4B701
MKPKTGNNQAEPLKKPSNWRKKHEDFIATIRAAKTFTQVKKDGGPLPPPPPPTYDPDYIQCPCCQRRFNKCAADRHIKFCQEQAARMPNKNKSDVKKTPARTQYKPSAPVIKVSTIPSTTSRLPQRSGLGQSTTIPASKMTSMKNNPSGLTSPPSGVGNKNRAVGSGYGPVRDAQTGAALNKKILNTPISRNDIVDMNDESSNGMKTKFCHCCGTKYIVESAKFCCHCGIKRMCI